MEKMNENVFSIVEADVSQAGLLADLSRLCFEQSFGEYNSPGNMEKFMRTRFAREALMKEVGVTGNLFFLALRGDQALGYAKMNESENPPELDSQAAVELSRIYVLKQAKAAGIGKALLDKVVETAIRMKKKVLWLGVWEQNSAAIGFYRKFGFNKFGEHVFMLGDDAQTDWLMQKRL